MGKKMVVSPTELIKIKKASERQTLAELEQTIDAKLSAEFDGSNIVQVDVSNQWRNLRLLAQDTLARKYERVGWKILLEMQNNKYVLNFNYDKKE